MSTVFRGGGGGAKFLGNAAVGEVLSGKTFHSNSKTVLTGTMANNGAVNQSLAINGTYTIPAGYHNGSGKVTQSITTKAAATITPTTSDQTIAAGQYLSGIQTIKGDANLVTGNILAGKTIFGVSGKASVVDTSAGTATAAQMLSGVKAYVNGSLVTGTITSKAAATITPTTSNQTIAAGQYLSGVQTIAGSANLVAANIKSGVNIFGVTGTYAGTGLRIKQILRVTYSPSAQTVTSDTFSINGTVVPENCIVLVKWTQNGSLGPDGGDNLAYVTSYTLNATTITVNMNRSIYYRTYRVEIIELESGVATIQRGVTTSALTTNISAVNMSKSLVFAWMTFAVSYANEGMEYGFAPMLTSSTVLNFGHRYFSICWNVVQLL